MAIIKQIKIGATTYDIESKPVRDSLNDHLDAHNVLSDADVPGKLAFLFHANSDGTYGSPYCFRKWNWNSGDVCYLGNASYPWDKVYATTYYGDLEGNANTASKVNNNLIIKLNSGNTEGTDLFTFNGSAGKTINITPSAIKADPEGSAIAAENRANGYADNQINAALTTAQNYTNNQINDLINGAPGTLNTLNELATALGNDENFSTTITNLIGTKLPLAGGTLTGNLIFNASTNANGTYINWGSVGGNAPYMGYAKDQSDGTFIICSMEKDTTTNGVKHYKNGLAIGGGSGNLFWKGARIVTANDTLKNPYSLTIKGNGTTLTNGTYDGSAAKTVDITPSVIGAAERSRLHDSSTDTHIMSVVLANTTTGIYSLRPIKDANDVTYPVSLGTQQNPFRNCFLSGTLYIGDATALTTSNWSDYITTIAVFG